MIIVLCGSIRRIAKISLVLFYLSASLTGCIYNKWHASHQYEDGFDGPSVQVEGTQVEIYISDFSVQGPTSDTIAFPREVSLDSERLHAEFLRTLLSKRGVVGSIESTPQKNGVFCLVGVRPRRISLPSQILFLSSVFTGTLLPFYGDINGYVVTYDLYVNGTLQKQYRYEISSTVLSSLVVGMLVRPWLTDNWKPFDIMGPTHRQAERIEWREKNSSLLNEGVGSALTSTARSFFIEGHRDGFF